MGMEGWWRMNCRWGTKEKGAGSRTGMLVVVGYTDTPTWICPGDWDQILHLSKATLHQRHSNEVVFYCKLSSRGVCVCVCVCARASVWVSVCACEGWESDRKWKKKNQGKERLKERCVGLSALSVSKGGIYKKCAHSMSAHEPLIYMILGNRKEGNLSLSWWILRKRNARVSQRTSSCQSQLCRLQLKSTHSAPLAPLTMHF